jgi:hypothetical protein
MTCEACPNPSQALSPATLPIVAAERLIMESDGFSTQAECLRMQC